MKPRRHPFRELGLVILLLLAFPGAAAALAPDELIVVFNAKMPESKAVAEYYALKRQVPPANLLGVEVSTSEGMDRPDFEQHLVPPVRAAAERLQAQGKAPAVLLVYGIPLAVQGPEETGTDKAFKTLATAKATEYRDLVLQMTRELEGLTGAPEPSAKPPRRLTYPAPQVLRMAEAALNRAAAYLKKTPAREAADPRIKVLSLIIRLSGTSTEARALLEKLAQGSAQERRAIRGQELLGWNAVLRRELDEQTFQGLLPETALEDAAAVRFTEGVIGEWRFWEHAQTLYDNPQKTAAVDSELTLALRDRYQQAGWLPNPYYCRYDNLPFIKEVRAKTLMAGRLDGPTPEIAQRLVDDALETEQTGLHGTLYIDARGLQGEGAYGSYAWYDRHLVDLYDLVKKLSSLPVVLDRSPNLFPPGSCPDAALYVGWYSLGKYVPSCRWRRGAVAYHVASSEATTLRRKASQVWCKRLLEEGVAATLGPVREPYLQSFPLPDEFFPWLMTGKLPLLEVYFRTLPQVSWMQTLIGDPLYTPFKQNPALPLPKAAAATKK